ncbi:MAG: ATP-binding cassette domain-containing protein [Candidatus Andersenbacteria bacterium]|nr:ATP-binding cassette domain-containing protein [Candidatus Andersenbacteria bacterium]MBI3250880.1 ATP-binding cassette domain-containing protein [Candidatus Andersenbacteria bacterium]
MDQSNSTIKVRGLTKSFKDLKVLTGIELEVKRGTVLALLGPNGAGKTTTIRILSTLLRPDGGDAFIDGHSVVKEPDKVRASIGLTGQYAAVDEYLTGRENLEMMGRLYHLSRADAKIRGEELLEQFDLEKAATRTVKTYSGGMRRRLDLAASLIATPPVLFLDEPTTGLDPRSRLAMWGIIEQLVEADVTILLTTQQLEEADMLADRIAVLDHGRIIVEGTSDELKAKVGKERLELTIRKDNYEKAIQLLGGEVVQKDPQRHLVSIATSGTVHEIKRVLEKMEAATIEVESMSVHKPTLDDVFLQFTGHGAEANQNTEELTNA